MRTRESGNIGRKLVGASHLPPQSKLQGELPGTWVWELRAPGALARRRRGGGRKDGRRCPPWLHIATCVRWTDVCHCNATSTPDRCPIHVPGAALANLHSQGLKTIGILFSWFRRPEAQTPCRRGCGSSTGSSSSGGACVPWLLDAPLQPLPPVSRGCVSLLRTPATGDRARSHPAGMHLTRPDGVCKPRVSK